MTKFEEKLDEVAMQYDEDVDEARTNAFDEGYEIGYENGRDEGFIAGYQARSEEINPT